MNTVKKLFLITAILGSAINTQLSASDPLLEFADKLDRYSTAEPKNIARWIRETYPRSDTQGKKLNEQLNLIINTDNTDTNKAKAIKAIWQEETTPKNNDGYFSNISTKAKAAAAFMITAGIISYLYFTRPWTTSPAQ